MFNTELPQDSVMNYEEVFCTLDSVSCSRHKILITNDTFAGAFLKAINYYPELCERKIRVQYGSIKTSMAALPRIFSILYKRDNRTYRIIINRNTKQLIYDAPFDACVGVMGHELAHILDYSTKSGCRLTWIGVRYLGKNYRRKMERQTDLVTIERGLGWELYNFANFIKYEADIDEKYRNYKLDMYMNPEEIFEIINR